ncbi:MAG: GNAT family N-acetyltransferase [Candidatus Heimdallarchaeaceae archaeon]
MSYEEKLEINGEELTLRTWNFEEDHENVSELLGLVFEEELESKGLEMKNVFDEYKSFLPFFKIMGLFNKNFKHTLDGFVIENSEGRIIASVNLSYSIYYWEISMVATHPDYRRKGLARKLVTLAVRHAKELGAKLCVLEVKEINKPAYNLYRSLQFIHYDSVSRYKLEHEKLSSIVPIILPKEYDFRELERNKKTNQSRYELDIRSTPEETLLFQPISKKKYHKSLLIKLIRPIVKLLIKMKISQWTIHHEDILIGTLQVNLARKE